MMTERQLDIIIQKLDELLAKNEKLEKLNAIKDDELALLREQVEYLTGKLYGRKKETLNINPNQSNLFDDSPFIEPEQTGDQSDEVVVIKEHGRKKKKD